MANGPNIFQMLLVSKFAVKLFLNIQPSITGVATLPGEIFRSENSDSPKHVSLLVITLAAR